MMIDLKKLQQGLAQEDEVADSILFRGMQAQHPELIQVCILQMMVLQYKRTGELEDLIARTQS